ncbi:hypothetical protein BpHYR1_034160, partial [Brachionus plicatilis]
IFLIMNLSLINFLILALAMQLVFCRSLPSQDNQELKPVENIQEVNAGNDREFEGPNDLEIYNRLIKREANIPYLVNFSEFKSKQNLNNHEESEEQAQDE